MTKEEARIIVLEDALRQAQHTVNFLHNCLVNPVDEIIKEGCKGYSYGYPDQTLCHLKEWRKLVPLNEDSVGRCYHSMTKADCESCQLNRKQRMVLWEARKVLDAPVV